MKKSIILLIILISWTSFSQSEKIPDRILTYGMNYGYNEARELVGKEWEIEIYPVAGCIISKELIDSVQKVHKKLWRKMDSIKGIGSEKKFQKELLAEEKRTTKVYEIFHSDKDIKKRKREIYETDGIVSIQNIESSSKDKNLYYVILYTVDTSNFTKKERKPDLKVEVNLTTMKTKIIDLK